MADCGNRGSHTTRSLGRLKDKRKAERRAKRPRRLPPTTKTATDRVLEQSAELAKGPVE